MTLARSAATVMLASCIVAAAMACSGGSSKTNTPDASQQTAVNPLPTSVTGDVPPLPTLEDPDSVPLVAQRGKLFDFNLSVPETWKLAPSDSSNGLDLFDIPNPGLTDPNTGQPLRVGYVTVECGPPKPPEGVAEYSSLALARAAANSMNRATGTGQAFGQADDASIHEVQIGSLTGATLESSIRLGPLMGRVDHVYIATPTCAWHLAMSIYSPGDEAPYFALFDRMVQTFRPEAPA